MGGADLDLLFREAVAAIDAGDVAALEGLLRVHPELARERLTEPGDWVRKQIGKAHFAVCSPIGREDRRQIQLIDALIDGGSSTKGGPVQALI